MIKKMTILHAAQQQQDVSTDARVTLLKYQQQQGGSETAKQYSDLGQIEKITEDEGGGDGQGAKLWLEGLRNSARAG